MRQSTKCGSVKNDEINIQLILGIWCEPLNQHLLPPARHHLHLLIPSTQTINQKKTKNGEMRFNSQQIVSYWYCFGLRTQNQGLKSIFGRESIFTWVLL